MRLICLLAASMFTKSKLELTKLVLVLNLWYSDAFKVINKIQIADFLAMNG